MLTDTIDFFEFKSPQEYLEITEIKKISEDVAKQLVEEKIMLFSSLFERQRVGYKGQHTEFVDCPDKYRPVHTEISRNGEHLRYFEGYANERHVFGSCDQETAKNYALNAFLYCPSSERLLDVRYFITVSPGSSLQPFIDNLSCANVN